ncbi:unnamed protein product, partial [Rotaria magnacalcarata]
MSFTAYGSIFTLDHPTSTNPTTNSIGSYNILLIEEMQLDSEAKEIFGASDPRVGYDWIISDSDPTDPNLGQESVGSSRFS